MDTSKKRKVSEEHRGFHSAWTELSAFTANDAGLPVCLICGEKLSKVLQPYVLEEKHGRGRQLTMFSHNSITTIFRVQL